MNAGQPGPLVLLRHGESAFNAEGRFTGLLDVPLTDRGREEAANAARLLTREELVPDLVYTSVLTRALETARLVRAVLGRPRLPSRAAWQLDERNYGSLTGLSKRRVIDEHGPDLFLQWRRTLFGQPPPMDPVLLRQLRQQPVLRHQPPQAVTATESLDDVRQRVEEIWRARIRADLQAGTTVLVIAHGNSLRALCLVLDRLNEREVLRLNIPTGQPLLYEFDDRLVPVTRGGRYLDPVEALAAAQQIAESGGT